MELFIDFKSDEAIYVQLCNQIIMSIATERIKEGIPSLQFVNLLIQWELICTQSIRRIAF